MISLSKRICKLCEVEFVVGNFCPEEIQCAECYVNTCEVPADTDQEFLNIFTEMGCPISATVLGEPPSGMKESRNEKTEPVELQSTERTTKISNGCSNDLVKRNDVVEEQQSSLIKLSCVRSLILKFERVAKENSLMSWQSRTSSSLCFSDENNDWHQKTYPEMCFRGTSSVLARAKVLDTLSVSRSLVSKQLPPAAVRYYGSEINNSGSPTGATSVSCSTGPKSVHLIDRNVNSRLWLPDTNTTLESPFARNPAFTIKVNNPSKIEMARMSASNKSGRRLTLADNFPSETRMDCLRVKILRKEHGHRGPRDGARINLKSKMTSKGVFIRKRVN